MKQNENYEKKYKEALDRASCIKDYNTIGTPQEIAELIFPELRENLKKNRGNSPKIPSISPKQTLEQAAFAFAERYAAEHQYEYPVEEMDVAVGFGAGAEWQKEDLAISFMHYLDAIRPEGKMCFSNGECADIDKAFDEMDWDKLTRYLEKYRKNKEI